jgi:hypothetical protein
VRVGLNPVESLVENHVVNQGEIEIVRKELQEEKVVDSLQLLSDHSSRVTQDKISTVAAVTTVLTQEQNQHYLEKVDGLITLKAEKGSTIIKKKKKINLFPLLPPQ